MTICIAALCENSEKIIVASDRMVTVGSIIEFEHDVPKFEKFTDNCIVMSAGSTTIQNDIIKETLSEIKTLRNPNFRQITEELKKAYVTIRQKKAEEVHLKPKGLTFETFYQNQRALMPEIVFQLMDGISKTNLGVEYILCGFEDTGHIHYIIDPGTSECFDTVGFCAIGTGNVNAVSVFTLHNYAPSFPIEKSLYLVYLAKKDAERAPGVGKETDILIISKAGIEHVNDKEKAKLDEVYNKYKQIEEVEYNDVKEGITEKWSKKDDKNAATKA